MDGRVQLPVIRYLSRRFHAEHVDSVTEPGPNAILARRTDAAAVEAIERRVRISIERHKSVGIAVVGHYDCAGNPADLAEQTRDTLAAVRYLEDKFPGIPVIGLWVNQAWEVCEISSQAATR
jgi:hypothetical protein